MADSVAPFNPGDVVCLKSGSDPMTVVSVEFPAGVPRIWQVQCAWFSVIGTGGSFSVSDYKMRIMYDWNARTATFPAIALKRVE